MMWSIALMLALGSNPPPAAIVMKDEPVMFSLNVPEHVRHAKVVSLRMETVVMKRNAAAVWNIFWNMPNANAQTPVTNEHFAGYIASPANSALRDPKPANFVLQLPEAAVVAMHDAETMSFTFVPVRKLPEGGVTIWTIRLE